MSPKPEYPFSQADVERAENNFEDNEDKTMAEIDAGLYKIDTKLDEFEEANRKFTEAMGIGKVIPIQHQYPDSEADLDLEIAEMLAGELEEISILYDADGMEKIRQFIKRKRVGTMANVGRV